VESGTCCSSTMTYSARWSLPLRVGMKPMAVFWAIGWTGGLRLGSVPIVYWLFWGMSRSSWQSIGCVYCLSSVFQLLGTNSNHNNFINPHNNFLMKMTET
jgi:hypothetical protein